MNAADEATCLLPTDTKLPLQMLERKIENDGCCRSGEEEQIHWEVEREK